MKGVWFLSSTCSVLTLFSSRFCPRGYKTTPSSNLRDFPPRCKPSRNEPSQLPQDFKTRVQELTFFACVHVHRPDTRDGGGRMLTGLAVALCSRGINLPGSTPTEGRGPTPQAKPEHCCQRERVNCRQQK